MTFFCSFFDVIKRVILVQKLVFHLFHFLHFLNLFFSSMTFCFLGDLMAGQIPLKKLSTKILCEMMLEYDDQSLSPAHRSVKGYGVKIIKQRFVSRCAFLLFIFLVYFWCRYIF